MEKEVWLKLINNQASEESPADILAKLSQEESQNSYSFFKSALELAMEYKTKNGGIPAKLEQVIQTLGTMNSGFTGLTNWEAWIGINRATDPKNPS